MNPIQRWMMLALMTASVIGLSVSLTACGGDEEGDGGETAGTPGAKPAQPAKMIPDVVRGEQGEIRYSGKTQDGESFDAQIGGDVTLPSALSGEVPPYPGSVATSAMEIDGGAAIAALDTKDSSDKVIAFYREKLVAGGWTIDDELSVGRGTVFTAKKGDRKVVVSVENTDEGSRYSLMLGPTG
jgi:hypothetical protein